MRIRAVLAALLLLPAATVLGQSGTLMEPLAPPPQPAENPTTPAKVNLGKALFWDEQLSSTRTVACGTCHIPASGGADPRAIAGASNAIHPGLDGIFGTPDDVGGSPGVPASAADGKYLWQSTYGYRAQVTGRNTNSAVDAAYAPSLFWDGRAETTFRDPDTNDVIIAVGGALENQALGPIVSDTEMAHSGRVLADAAVRIGESKPLALAFSIPSSLQAWISERTYPQLFAEAFGTPDVTPARMAMAMASYQRTLISHTPFDDAISGGTPLSPQEQAGRFVFEQSFCHSCHTGALLSDNQFHYIGVRPAIEDMGRFAITADPMDEGSMRTPSLRNVGLRKTFFHNGRFSTLEQVVEFYNRGGDFDAVNKSHAVFKLALTPEERADLLAFLGRPLIDPRAAAETAPFDRPRLYSESRCQPELVGEGIPGTGGVIPAAIALEPPLSGNPNFTVAVAGALSGAAATLVIDSADPGADSGVPSSGAFAYQAITLESAAPGAPAGRGSITLAIPSDAAFIGATYFGRWYVTDPSAAGGVAVSPAFRFTIFDVCPDSICMGDSNADGVVDFDDITSILSHWNGVGPAGDANRDRSVNVDDILVVLTAFGSVCPQ